MTKPKASVVVPLYNSRSTIEACLRAIRAQQGFGPGELELVVVDDGSQDGGGELARGRCDQLIALEPNQGAAVARNQGAAKARADLIVFVDADVVLEPAALSALLAVFADPKVAAAVGRYAETPAVPGTVNLYHNAFTRYHHDLSPAEIDWFWGAIGAVRREALLLVGGFDERYQGASAEDMELGLKLAEAGRALRYAPAAMGAHAHHFSLAGMLVNDYKKAVLGTKLRLRGRLPRQAPGFASAGNALTAPLFAALLATLFGQPLSAVTAIVAALIFAGALIVNDRYYSYLAQAMQGKLDAGVALHVLQSAAIGAGAGAGLLGHLAGRSPYGRPGWW